MYKNEKDFSNWTKNDLEAKWDEDVKIFTIEENENLFALAIVKDNLVVSLSSVYKGNGRKILKLLKEKLGTFYLYPTLNSMGFYISCGGVFDGECFHF